MYKKLLIFSLAMVLLMIAGCSNSTSKETESFIIIKSNSIFNSQSIDSVVNMAQEVKAGNSNYLVVEHDGKDVTEKYMKLIPDDENKIAEFIKDNSEKIQFVEKGKFRITTWKNEIDELFEDNRNISQITRDKDTNMLISAPPQIQIRTQFISEVEEWYKKREYEKIIDHISEKEYIIYSEEDI
jgi:hypothetical protein